MIAQEILPLQCFSFSTADPEPNTGAKGLLKDVNNHVKAAEHLRSF